MTELDPATHRALVEAGYAPLDEYIAVSTGGCAPPVLVPAARRVACLQAAEFLQPVDDQPNRARTAQIGQAVIVILAAIGAAALAERLR